MKRTMALVILGALGLAAAGLGAAVDRAELAKKQASLATEYSLAKDSNFYFVFDVLGRKLELRVRGMVLRSWPLQSMRFWGSPGFSGTVELVKKTTLKAPERIIIKPGDSAEPEPAAAAQTAKPAAAGAAATNAAEFDLEALELRDMPRVFSLDFDNGLHITVKAKGAGSTGLAGTFREAWRWYIDLPLRNLFGSREGKKISELELTFEKDTDAQAIYWHLFDSIKGIIL
jgi:hypothetical protein